MPIDVFIIDGVHQLTNQENTQSANLALFSRECDVNLFLNGRIKRRTSIVNHYFQPMAV